MNEELVSFETAKLAKEKGFKRIISIGGYTKFYNSDGLLQCRIRGLLNKKLTFAPTQSLLQKWLREKHDFHIEIFLEEDTPYRSFYYRTMKLGQYFRLSHGTFKSESYEIVLEEALKDVLNSIKI